MKEILVKLKPLEPYFFGSNRIFDKGFDENCKERYYITSEKTPSQTTLFGVLRYLGLNQKQRNYTLSEDDEKNIGSESYSLVNEDQTFGKIIGISPLYIIDKENNIYIKTPFDHKISEKEYSPFVSYCQEQTSIGDKILPVEYDPKKGISDSYLRVKDGKIVNDIFNNFEKVGVHTDRSVEGFFKKKYQYMTEYSFAFYARVKENFPVIKESIVYMGQGKSTFSVESHADKEPVNDVKRLFDNYEPLKVNGKKYFKAYALSDIYIGDKLQNIIENCDFSIIDVKNSGIFKTNYGKKSQKCRFEKKGQIIRLIKAGSIFVFSDTVLDELKSNLHAKMAGFNNLVIGGEKQ